MLGHFYLFLSHFIDNFYWFLSHFLIIFTIFLGHQNPSPADEVVKKLPQLRKDGEERM